MNMILLTIIGSIVMAILMIMTAKTMSSVK